MERQLTQMLVRGIAYAGYYLRAVCYRLVSELLRYLIRNLHETSTNIYANTSLNHKLYHFFLASIVITRKDPACSCVSPRRQPNANPALYTPFGGIYPTMPNRCEG